MARRLHKTLVDYLVIAISPALIMTLVGSLVFFLIEVFYQGNFQGRLQYIFALFVIGAVLIGRISIEEGRERAALFAVPLGIAPCWPSTGSCEFQGGALASLSFLINCGLIALVWWSADKLTWDCTLIDESEEDSGEGLLEAVGLDRPGKAALQQGDRRPRPPEAGGDHLAGRSGRRAGGSGSSSAAAGRTPPAFGSSISRWPHCRCSASASSSSRPAICPPGSMRSSLLCVYTASGLGLLLSTSFLGLRRYLRQRRQEMPLAMVNLWLGIGGVLIVGVMLAAMLLPRPNAEYAISELPFRIGSPDQRQKSSPYGTGRDGVREKQPWSQGEQTTTRPAAGHPLPAVPTRPEWNRNSSHPLPAKPRLPATSPNGRPHRRQVRTPNRTPRATLPQTGRPAKIVQNARAMIEDLTISRRQQTFSSGCTMPAASYR